MKALDKEIFDILDKYIDMNYVSYHRNIIGIEVARYSDHIDFSYDYMEELRNIGFEKIADNDVMSEKYLCGISYCEGDVMVVYYESVNQFNEEKQRAIEFHKNN